MEALLAGLFGLLIGSFLNVCIYRLPLDLSVVAPRSFCPNCKTQIAWYDNIPLLSYIALRGRSRCCRQRISIRYPVVEMLTGGLFFAVFLVFGPTLDAVKGCVFAAVQVALIFTDFEERILPDEFTLGGMLAGFVFAVFLPMPGGLMQLFVPYEWNPRIVSVIESVFSAVFLSGTLWSVGALYKAIRGEEGLGLGDVKMVGTIGAFLGLSGALLSVMVGSVLGSIGGLAYIWLTRNDAKTYPLPFGSFLAVGALAALFGSAGLLRGGM